MKRGMTVLKMRGSMHDKRFREFSITREGMHIGRPFRNITGILAGEPVRVSPADVERVWTEMESDVSRPARQESHRTEERRRGHD